MSRISVVISAFNEESRIEECLSSVKFADEIIFINNSSTDKTLEIAKKFTSKIFTKPNNLMLNVNKNFGFTRATGDWILSLDADERVTPELQKEIISVTNSSTSKADGYWIPRKNIIFGKWIKHTGWYPDYQLRLFKKGKGQFEEKHVHEMLKLNGEAGYLKNPMLHINYETIEQFLHKLINIYTPNESEQLLLSGYIFDWRDAIRFPAREFISRYFAREGYKDGFHGLVLSLLMAFYHFMVFAYIWEKQKFKETDENVLKLTENEFKDIVKKTNYWITTEKIEQCKNSISKILLKMKRKLLK